MKSSAGGTESKNTSHFFQKEKKVSFFSLYNKYNGKAIKILEKILDIKKN